MAKPSSPSSFRPARHGGAPTPTPFVAHASPWRAALCTLGALGGALLGLWQAGVVGAAPPTYPGAAAVGWAGAVLFATAAGFSVAAACRRGVVIRVDADGITACAWSRRPIPWAAVAGAAVRGDWPQRTLSLELVDPAAYPPDGRWLRWVNRWRLAGYGDLPIVTGVTDRSLAELVAAVRAFAPDRFEAARRPTSRLYAR